MLRSDRMHTAGDWRGCPYQHRTSFGRAWRRHRPPLWDRWHICVVGAWCARTAAARRGWPPLQPGRWPAPVPSATSYTLAPAASRQRGNRRGGDRTRTGTADCTLDSLPPEQKNTDYWLIMVSKNTGSLQTTSQWISTENLWKIAPKYLTVELAKMKSKGSSIYIGTFKRDSPSR